MADGILCVVGLGNPGDKYAGTRHNAGYWLVDELARRHQAPLRMEAKFQGEVGRIDSSQGRCWLLKPTTYMNHSGRAVAALARFYKLRPEQILIAHDELDLPCGTVRLKRGGGHGGHNGLKDSIRALGSPDFYRLRIGIDHPGHKDQVVDYVLSPPRRDEARAIEEAIERAVAQFPLLLKGEFQQVMNELHRRP